MKKTIILVCIIAITFSSVSCIGWERGVVSSSITTQGVESSTLSTKTEQISTNKNTKIQAKLNQVVMKKWVVDNYINAHVAIELENTGREKFKVEQVEVDFISDTGDIVFENEIKCWYLVTPDILLPGDVAYSGKTFTFKQTNSSQDFDKIELTVHYSQTLRTRNEQAIIKKVEVDSIEMDFPFSNSPMIQVDIAVFSETELEIKYPDFCVALFDTNMQLLGAINRSYDNIQLTPNEEKVVKIRWTEISTQAIPVDEIKTIKGFCYTYPNEF